MNMLILFVSVNYQIVNSEREVKVRFIQIYNYKKQHVIIEND